MQKSQAFECKLDLNLDEIVWFLHLELISYRNFRKLILITNYCPQEKNIASDAQALKTKLD